MPQRGALVGSSEASIRGGAVESSENNNGVGGVLDIVVDEGRQCHLQRGSRNALASISMGPVEEDGLVVGPGMEEGSVTT